MSKFSRPQLFKQTRYIRTSTIDLLSSYARHPLQPGLKYAFAILIVIIATVPQTISKIIHQLPSAYRLASCCWFVVLPLCYHFCNWLLLILFYVHCSSCKLIAILWISVVCILKQWLSWRLGVYWRWCQIKFSVLLILLRKLKELIRISIHQNIWKIRAICLI